MAKLTAKARKLLPKTDFVFSGGKKSYPIPNASHARNALSRVAQYGSPSEKTAVKAKVKAKFPGIDSKKKVKKGYDFSRS